MTTFPESLPEFMAKHVCNVSYAVACSMAKHGTLPGVSENPHGYGWVISDPQKARKSLKVTQVKSMEAAG